ncbi:Metallo-dependent phosphatase [Pseudovirgaria hyperparasitica]|uniref:Metallo-dependent phosphatase n=1 Tax=Pseudovirgaria hyperparasitica TaxID=470096 RepID=A0A6A6WH34_9PEZI|nr:Metallo-dependent phosphatase [Pseudovirgaria hyperparasitica]KAF2761296.1 Metallo-dependent phosphatase [Pseudovirgaria hyperparasitica]
MVFPVLLVIIKALFASFIIVALLAGDGVGAEDVLLSKRVGASTLGKRGLDQDGNYNISFFHINDVHAHLDEFSTSGTDCTHPERGCYGGAARIKHTLDTLRPQHADSLFLNAGDEFQGTLFYTYYGGEKIAATLNQLGVDAMTLGNHEFDGGDSALGAFLANLTFPIVSANVRSTHPVLNATIRPYVVFEEKKLAVIGVTTATTPSISKPGNGTVFLDVVKTVQDTVDHIRATTGVVRIAALTHIGYEEDKRLAEATTGLFLIMGGHSHTPLGDFEGAKGPYPTIAHNKDGDEVFIVTAYRWGEYLGYIDVTYAPDGKILAYHGAPIHLTNQTQQDDSLKAQVKQWRGPFEKFAAEVVGQSSVTLEQANCKTAECTLGDVMCDAMLAYRRNESSDSSVNFALINAGGVRAPIDQGPITRGEILTAFPFGNAIVDLKLRGNALWDTLEGIVSGTNTANGAPVTSFFQVSAGIVVEYNPGNEPGKRLVRVTIGGKPLDKSAEYTLVTLDFLAGGESVQIIAPLNILTIRLYFPGGDNIFTPTTNLVVLDTQDVVLTNYVQAHSPINIEIEGRIRVVNGSGTPMDSVAVPSPSAMPSPESAASSVLEVGRLLLLLGVMLVVGVLGVA